MPPTPVLGRSLTRALKLVVKVFFGPSCQSTRAVPSQRYWGKGTFWTKGTWLPVVSRVKALTTASLLMVRCSSERAKSLPFFVMGPESSAV